jgi:IS1 family transposase
VIKCKRFLSFAQKVKIKTTSFCFYKHPLRERELRGKIGTTNPEKTRLVVRSIFISVPAV